MSRLYSDLARIYYEMYQSIFNYGREYRRCHAILTKHSCKRILEAGCGSGNLAPRFLAAGYDYTGVDLAAGMLRIARREAPGARFLRGDMRRLPPTLTGFDAIYSGGRCFAYMVSNRDVQQALASFHRALKPGGILIFDNFDAAAIFPNRREPITQRVEREGRRYTRVSTNTPNLATGWTWNWRARYVVEAGGRRQTFRDDSVLRAFTPDELKLFLRLAGFATLGLRRRSAALFAVARKGSAPIRNPQ